eukprot:Hpha_TRINITY_DN16341_c1_g18::TRINITY_DN16341_c1_g18_i1::g.59793::m.59793
MARALRIVVACVMNTQLALAISLDIRGASRCAEMQGLCLGWPGEITLQFAHNEPTHDYFGCLLSTERRNWFQVKVEGPGKLGLSIVAAGHGALEYDMWGPFPSSTAARDECGGLGRPAVCSEPSGGIPVPDMEVNTGDVFVLLVINPTNDNHVLALDYTEGSTTTLDCSLPASMFPATPAPPPGSDAATSTSASPPVAPARAMRWAYEQARSRRLLRLRRAVHGGCLQCKVYAGLHRRYRHRTGL